jgi:MoaA/NifB/PqqE/SkfB family radical SAM enzyme
VNASSRYFRDNGIRDPLDQQRLHEFLVHSYNLSQEDVIGIRSYLETRAAEVKGKDTFGVVYDITRYCNLECAHCCVSAMLTHKQGSEINWETNTEQSRLILKKIYDHVQRRGIKNVFVIFGGGEPTMRPDFEEVAAYAASLFGPQGVGVNTNGTYCNIDRLLAMEESLGFIEVSIDGFEEYHNRWRNPRSRAPVDNPFHASINFVSNMLRYPSLRDKLEVSSAVTTENIDSLDSFVGFLVDMGVENYSIHRAMPVGRMGARLEKIPSSEQYIRLLLLVARLRQETPMKSLHLHHSLESIYSVLFLGRDIHRSDLLTGSGRHSIGLDPQGNVYFDPWGVIPPFNKFAAGNLLEVGVTLTDIIERDGSLIRLADEVSRLQLRCRGCRMNCTGGMRFNALGHYVFRTTGKLGNVDESQLIAGLSEIDPACPLYEP